MPVSGKEAGTAGYEASRVRSVAHRAISTFCIHIALVTLRLIPSIFFLVGLAKTNLMDHL